MISRQQLDRIVLRIAGKDIRLVGFWAHLPDLEQFRTEYARELGVSETQLMRCRDIVDVLDLAGNGRTTRQDDAGQPSLL